MRKLVLEILAATALTLAAILALAPGVRASDIAVVGAFARASAVSTAKAGTAYLTLINHGAEPDRLLSIATEAAANAQLHRTTNEDGIARMQPVESLDLPAGAMVELKPGGLHVMMTGLRAPLVEGGSLTLHLTFEKAGEVEVKVPVGAVAAGHDHAEGSSGG
ncbi:MAG: copper chaperone PCu(A)C [Hyphomicrobiales bacterium]